jgi:hypothetical protein
MQKILIKEAVIYLMQNFSIAITKYSSVSDIEKLLEKYILPEIIVRAPCINSRKTITTTLY